MFKRKKKKQDAEGQEAAEQATDVAVPTSDDTATPMTSSEPPRVTAQAETAAALSGRDDQPSEIGTAPDTSKDATTRGQFRSWVVDGKRGYSRLTDQQNGLIVLKFAEKPVDEILTAVKDAGFQYKPDHHGQKSVWVRRNDAQGRLGVESIEILVRGNSVEREA